MRRNGGFSIDVLVGSLRAFLLSVGLLSVLVGFGAWFLVSGIQLVV